MTTPCSQEGRISKLETSLDLNHNFVMQEIQKLGDKQDKLENKIDTWFEKLFAKIENLDIIYAKKEEVKELKASQKKVTWYIITTLISIVLWLVVYIFKTIPNV